MGYSANLDFAYSVPLAERWNGRSHRAAAACDAHVAAGWEYSIAGWAGALGCDPSGAGEQPASFVSEIRAFFRHLR